MPGLVLKGIFDAVETLLVGITDPVTSTPLFGSGPARIYYMGEQMLSTVMPSVAVRFGEETTSNDLEPTSKTRHQLPWDLQVFFNSGAFGSPPTLINGHTRIYGLIKDALYADRTISGSVIDTRYVGGGTALDPEDQEDAGIDRWSFTMRFESLYGHLDTDTDTPA